MGRDCRSIWYLIRHRSRVENKWLLGCGSRYKFCRFWAENVLFQSLNLFVQVQAPQGPVTYLHISDTVIVWLLPSRQQTKSFLISQLPPRQRHPSLYFLLHGSPQPVRHQTRSVALASYSTTPSPSPNTLSQCLPSAWRNKNFNQKPSHILPSST